MKVLQNAFAIAAVFLTAGCGSGLPDLAPVEGKVLLDNKPLSNAIVTFTPLTSNGRPSVGETDAEGHFTLYYLQDVPGALIDQHQIVVEHITDDIADNVADDPDERDPGDKAPIVLPPTASNGSIVKEVTDSSNDITIDLGKSVQQNLN